MAQSRTFSLLSRALELSKTQRCRLSTSSRVVFSGVQPTGVPHLGNYLGALSPWLELQKTASPETRLIFTIADLHSLTVKQDPAVLSRWRKEMMACWLAIGLDPKRCTMFFQSDVAAHGQLMWILGTTASVGHLSRMTQWKTKLQVPEDSTLDNAAARSKLRLGLFSYPVLQAADILLYGTTDIPVGEDQKQHIEFTRDVARSFNHLYGDIFTIPSAMISSTKRVMSLKEPWLKMSKSHTDPRSRILVTDSPDEIRLKIKGALTDSQHGVTYDRKSRPGLANLLEILAHMEGDDGDGALPDALAKDFDHGGGIQQLKQRVADKTIDRLHGIRDQFGYWMSEERSKHIEDIAAEGAVAAQDQAAFTMRKVRTAIGT